MASFAGSSKDTVADLLVDKSASPPPGAKPAKAPDTEKKHYASNNDGETMEALLEGSGGPDTPRIESKKHLPPPPDAMVGGEVGLTTDSQAPFVPSIAMVTEKPSDNGNLTKQDYHRLRLLRHSHGVRGKFGRRMHHCSKILLRSSLHHQALVVNYFRHARR